jgi:hypothetical protein
MSEFLHPGQHPDADQLSAFAEHVLPGHERVDMLAHLAECADCRQIVFLGQRAQEAQTPLSAAPRSHVGWLKHWGRLWPVAAAVACGLIVAALVQRRHPVEVPQQSEIAVESGAPISPSQMQLSHPIVPGVPASGPVPSPKSSTTAKVTSSLHPSPAAPRAGVGGSASVHGNVVTDQLADKLPEFSPNTPASGRQSTNALSPGTSLNGARAIGSPVVRERPLEEQKNNPFNDNGAPPAVLQSQGQHFSQQATAPPPSSAPSRSNIQQSVNQTVTVAGEGPMLQTESAVVSANVSSLGRVAQAKSMRAPLPSKLPAVSTISNGHETLAVDSEGDLFVSEDASIRWRQVAHQWMGKAVKVSLTSPNSRPEPALSLSADATASKNTETAKPAAVATRIGFELTTDTGAVWSSPDGIVWKQR